MPINELSNQHEEGEYADEDPINNNIKQYFDEDDALESELSS